jgi:Resolvase, N terminal domain
MTQVGYARVSSAGQSLEVQLAKLAGCQKIFQEQHSGSSDKRPRLLACLEYTFSGGYAKTPPTRSRRPQGLGGSALRPSWAEEVPGAAET